MDPCVVEVIPQDAQADSPVNCLVRGLNPGEQVTLKASTNDEAGKNWESWGSFVANGSGQIDLSHSPPVSGSWSVPSGSGFLWSLRPKKGNSKLVPLFKKKELEPIVVKVEIIRKNGCPVEAEVVRRFIPRQGGVVREVVDDLGVKGALFYSCGAASAPTLVVLSGSGGGWDEPRGALLAAHGFTVLSLAYFGVEGLPRELSQIPVEFFKGGLEYLSGHPAADLKRLGVFGFSKGGELALLLGSLYPEIRAVAAFSGSCYLWQGLKFGRPSSSWTRGGKDLPFLPMKVTLGTVFKLMMGRPVAFRRSYQKGLKSASDPRIAEIQAEKINGPIFLAAGTDDQVWPAVQFSDRMVKTLDSRDYPFEYRYLREQAGHLVCLPYLPAAQLCRNLVFSTTRFEHGSLASIKAWEGLIKFFRGVL